MRAVPPGTPRRAVRGWSPVYTLTERILRGIVPEETVRRYHDGNGLYIEVAPKGRRAWVYKLKAEGRYRRLVIGRWPEMSLDEARSLRPEAWREISGRLRARAAIQRRATPEPPAPKPGRLSERAVRAVKPTGIRRKIWDGNGLYLDVNARGDRSWFYHLKANGRVWAVRVGRYPAMSLAAARASRQEARLTALLRSGADPAEAARLAATPAPAPRKPAKDWKAVERPTYRLTEDVLDGQTAGPWGDRLFDGDGLYLARNPEGVRTWLYRFRIMGVSGTVTVGAWPETSLDQARKSRPKAWLLLARKIGADPTA